MRENGEPEGLVPILPLKQCFKIIKPSNIPLFLLIISPFFFKLNFRFIKKIDKPYVLRDKNIIKKELN